MAAAGNTPQSARARVRRSIGISARIARLRGGKKGMSTVAVVGLGYVGLPLAAGFGRKFRTVGFDLNADKVASYRRHLDPTGEVSSDELRAATQLTVTDDPTQLA